MYCFYIRIGSDYYLNGKDERDDLYSFVLPLLMYSDRLFIVVYVLFLHSELKLLLP